LIKLPSVPITLFEGAQRWIGVIDELIEEIYCVVGRKGFAISANNFSRRYFFQDGGKKLFLCKSVCAKSTSWSGGRGQSCIACC